jgi:hypothetical protein
MGGSTLYRLRVFAASALVVGGSALAPAAAEAAGVAGRVLADARPVSEVTVYAYQVVEKSLRSSLTDAAGEFRFGELPAGLYKIIAHKSGFAPVVLVVTRRAAADDQFVQVELPAAAAPPVPADAADFWELRSEVPADVLRELETPLGAFVFALADAAPARTASFLTEVAARTSVAELEADRRAQLVSGELGLAGRLGAVRLAVDGDFQTLASGSAPAAATTVEGEATALRLRLEGPATGRFDLATESERLLTVVDGGENPVGFERFQLRYHRDFGEQGSTAVVAQYQDETGLYADRRVHPLDLPRASRALRIEGNFSRALGESMHLRSGLRFRETVRDYADERSLDGAGVESRYVDAWSFADWTLDSTYVVQYGLYSTARDGSVSIAPRGGLLVRFAPDWQASVSATRRFELAEVDDWRRGEFTPALLESALGCADAEASCYEVQLLHGEDESEQVRVGASWREFDRTVRLFLDDDAFSGEGLFLVPGDRLPEVHATFHRPIGTDLVGRWTSSFAEGGGGTFLAANRRAYTNEVRYLSSALETTYRPTSTGVYLAFHRVEQRLEPVRRAGGRRSEPANRLETLELGVSQDLSAVLDVATDWAVRVGFELLRGGTLFEAVPTEGEQLRHRLTTGVAVRF